MAETHQAEMAGQLAIWTTRGGGKAAQEEPRGPAKVIQLPLWPELSVGRSTRCCGVRCSRPSRARAGSPWIVSWWPPNTGIEIRFTGWQLNQSDLDVWEQVLHLARTQALGTRCYFTAHGFLKALGRSTGKRDHEWLKSVFSRLSATDVQIRHKGRTYFGSLIEGGIRDEDTGRYVVEINPKLAAFYGRTQWTQLDWEQRQQLRGKPLALWLHGFYASHAKPYPLSVAYLHKLSGSQTKQLRYFKKNLAEALSELVTVGAVAAFEILGDLVHVRTVPSKSQQKHLAARRPPNRRRK